LLLSLHVNKYRLIDYYYGGGGGDIGMHGDWD
jgi:hypothetical protein